MAEPEDPKVWSIASSISDARPVDWEQLEGPAVAASETGDVLRELRLLDRIATFHRSADRPDSGGAGLEPPATSDGADHDEGDALQTWGHLAVIEKIGEGAFGTVYRARDSKLQREVALKLLWPSEDGSSGSRALKEARLLARIRHPNVATVYGADEIRGRVGLWMEFVKGRTLADILRTQGPLSGREAALIGLDLCRALAAVHAAGLLHGDVKAHNVMREEGGRTVLMDFGTGKDLTLDPAARRGAPVSDFAGTPLYVAPEVFAGHSRTKAADIYSLGVLMYHLVTDAYPVDGRTRGEVEDAHQRMDRRHLRDVRPDLPAEFVQTVERALAADPGDRYQSAGALESGLARFLGATSEFDRPWIPMKLGRVSITVCALLAAAALGSAYWFLPGGPRGAVAGADVARPAAAAPPGSYQIDTALYRETAGPKLRLRPGARVSPGDQLFVEVRASVPTYVYIVNEDERGESYLLFPLPGQNVSNPLPASKATRLPGARRGEEMTWTVDKAGGREHFLIFASPERMPAFERMFASLRQPEESKPIQAAPLGREAMGALRSVGGLAPAPVPPPFGAGPLTLQFSTPLGEGEETAHGLWVRQLTLENPSK